jgi:fructose-1-phosphate kinase PfkB-like protein
MRIIFERSGGIMGLKSSLTIDLDGMPLDQAETLRRLLGEADFFTLSGNPPTRLNPDAFQYSLTVESENAKHTVRTTDMTMPESLRPLIDKLSQLARMQRRV